MKQRGRNDHAVFFQGTSIISWASCTSRASQASNTSWARLFYECASSVVGFAITVDEKLAIDEALADIGAINIDVLYSC